MSFKEKVELWRRTKEAFEKEGEREKRRAICRTCEQFVNLFTAGQWCGKCRCNMQIKTAMMESRCPLNPPKWEKFVLQVSTQ
jgi:hypothetical protein